MNEHLDEMRVMELALNSNTSLDNNEQAHMACCDLCNAKLKYERQLTKQLSRLPKDSPPDDFVIHTITAFNQEYRRNSQRYLWGAFTTVLFLAAGISLSIVFNLGSFLTGIYQLFGSFLAGTKATFAVAAISPALTLVILGGTCFFATVGCLLLAGIFKQENKNWADSHSDALQRQGH